jgi:hypothetical protein
MEVCHFVNDVAVEVNCDLLTICTSRPQGYSGQFSNLDGMTIELKKLSREQALQCAKPVVELGRTQVESKKFVHTLTYAINSPAVQELMTTPLQAHIMAIVVRSGERPPERRWKLFTNFYQVIKRREANRELPDKCIAKLLREDEKLLKSVHNSLGFVLHSKAESSQGAETRLNRDDFRDLVSTAVSQMVETDIDKTVDVVMSATTDRLVLVSTPDDGNHVRFDIRQLQEFFAAEFIYESSNADQLRERLQLIAGDAHWREVVHFLLSALIEENRKTELAVAIEVLENLNEGEEDFRLLGTRLARGAILAARLLQEGVLEQDKRIRQQFRKSLEPLVGSMESTLLSPLTQINHPNSAAWLYTFLIDCLIERTCAENVGAGNILVQILPDNHERSSEVSEFISDAPSNYLSALLTSSSSLQDLQIERHSIHKSIMPKKWFVKLLINIFLGSKWSTLSEGAFASAKEIISAAYREDSTLLDFIDVSQPELDLLKIFLGNPYEPSSKLNIIESTDKDYGFIKIRYRENCFLTSKSDAHILEDLSKTRSLFQIIQITLQYLKTGTRSHFINYMEWFESNAPHLIYSFSSVFAIDRINLEYRFSVSSCIDHLSSLSDEDFLGDFRSSAAKMIYRTPKEKFDLMLFKQLVEEHVEIALHFWLENDVLPTLNESNCKFIETTIIENLLERPILLRNMPNVWGRLIKINSDNAPNIRNAIRESVVGVDVIEDKHPQLIRSLFSSFELFLPSEACLIPHMMFSLLDRKGVLSGARSFNIPANKKIIRESREIAEQIALMVPNSNDLRAICEDQNLDLNVRAASMIMLILHPDSNTKIMDERESLVRFYKSLRSSWYIKILTAGLCLLSPKPDSSSRWVVNQILADIRLDYESRKYLQPILALWRESSQAPVQTAGVQKKWLTDEESEFLRI